MEAGGPKIIVASAEMKTVMAQVQSVLNHDVIVLLLGKSGVGKEVVARYIHAHSARAARPFIPVNCGAIPQTLFEAEFFGMSEALLPMRSRRIRAISSRQTMV
ncbi:MAG: sigma-54 factor interaction domain-containing protein [candidate division KSB1 bacterium]|nr:sigma-54 factor interaction domain-containing protein [candidate division KSB1 bacterium]